MTKPVGHILTFHSQNIAGNDFATNDHVALDRTLQVLREVGVPVLRLATVVRLFRFHLGLLLPKRFVAFTFDDGPDYDWHEIRHPQHGKQKPLAAILRKHRATGGGVSTG